MPDTAAMPDTPQALRITSDALLRDLDALGTLEEQKRELPLDDPRLPELATQIQVIAERVLAHTDEQRSLTEAVARAGGHTATIASVERSPASILAEWREIERRAADAEPGSAEQIEVELLAEALREEYRAAFEAATKKG